MRVAITEHNFSLHYELTLHEDDRQGGETSLPGGPTNKLELAGRRFTVSLPGEFRTIHPDTHATAIWWYLRPFIGSTLHLPFEVSEAYAQVMQAHFGLTLPRVNPALAARAMPEQPRDGLLFSGGMDSVAASLVAPPETVGIFLDRIPRLMNRPEYRNTLIDLVNQRAVSRLRRAGGMTMIHVADDHEALFRPYPTWHANMDCIAAFYLADSLPLGNLFTGDVLDVFHFRGYVSEEVDSWTFRPEEHPTDPPREGPTTLKHRLADANVEDFNPMALVGLGRVDLVRGLTEIGTATIVSRSPFLGRTFSCYQKSEGFFCMACDKCFKKLLLLKVLQGEEVPAPLIDHFLSYPYLAQIFSRPFFEWHHIWTYIFQRIRCSHWFIRELQRQALQGPDLSLLEKWYPPSRNLIPEAYRHQVEEAITGYVPAMTPAEITTLEALSVPPLDPPDLSRPRPGARGHRQALSDPLLAGRISWVAPNKEKEAGHEGAAGALSGPHERQRSHWALNTTIRCQHRCVYCFEGGRQGKVDLPADQIRSLIDRAAEDVPMLVFMGAEPTLGPHIIEMTRYATELGLEVLYSTNALRFADDGFLERCIDAGLKGIELSFHYPDAEVYSQITRAKPALFGRLLRALDNINARNRGKALAPRSLPVNVNLVVSRFNISRLGEVIGHLQARLADTSPCITLRRVMLGSGPGGEGLMDSAYVPLRLLREMLTETLDGFDPVTGELLARGFPLCAIPGHEHRDGDLLYLLDNIRIRNNFDDQDNDASMLADHHVRTIHPFSWICETCKLEPICLQRGLFDCTRGRAEDAPMRCREGLSPELARAISRSKQRLEVPSEILDGEEAKQSPAARLLRALWAAHPPGQPVGTPGWAWEPVRELELHVSAGGSGETVSVLVSPETGENIPGRGRVALAPCAGRGDPPTPELQQALNQITALLDGILDSDAPLARELCASLGASGLTGQAGERDLGDSLLRRFAEQFLAETVLCQDLPLGGGFEPLTHLPERLSSLTGPNKPWSDAVTSSARAILRDDPELAMVRVGGYNNGLCIRRGEELELHGLLTSSLSHRMNEGFLCGLLGALPGPKLTDHLWGRKSIRALGKVLMEAQRSGRWPEEPPHPDARQALAIWRRFGMSLLPHQRGPLLLRSGEVSRSTVRLRFWCGESEAASLWLMASPDSGQFYGHDGVIGLRYKAADGFKGHPVIIKTVDWYAERLMK